MKTIQIVVDPVAQSEKNHTFFFFYNLTVLSLFGNNYILFIKAQIYANCSASGWICRHSNTRTAYSIDVLQFFLLVFPFKNDFQMS